MGFAILGLLGIGLLLGAIDSGSDSSAEPEVDTDGDGGDDTLRGSEGDDRIFARGGNDFVYAGGGDDQVFGGAGEDFLLGQSGEDFMRGGDATDLLVGGMGEDALVGDGGDDILISANIVDETAVINAIVGGGAVLDPANVYDFDQPDDGADTASGGAGDDILLSGAFDTVTGGSGADTFGVGFWMDDAGATTITDYTAGEDAIVYTYEGPRPSVSIGSDAGDATIEINGTVVAILRGVAPGDITTADVGLESLASSGLA